MNNKIKNLFSQNLIFWALPLIWSAYVCLYLLFIWTKESLNPISFSFFTSWDEYQFISQLSKYQNLLLDAKIYKFLTLGDDFGYGGFFWQIYALLSLPFYNQLISDDGSFLLKLRLITLFFQIASIWTCFMILNIVVSGKNRLIAAIFFTSLLLPMPGIMLVARPFAPDYLATFILLKGILHFCRYLVNHNEKNLLFTFFLMGMAISTKINNLFSVCFLFLSFLAVQKELLLLPCIKQIKKIKRILFLALCFFIGVTCTNLIWLTMPKAYFNKIYSIVEFTSRKDYMHAIKEHGLLNRIIHWYSNNNPLTGINTAGIKYEFFNLGLLILPLLFVLFSLSSKIIKKSNHAQKN